MMLNECWNLAQKVTHLITHLKFQAGNFFSVKWITF